MGAKEGTPRKMKTGITPRVSISFPSNLYKTIEAIAKQKKVSLAWVVRDAAEKYVADKWPLLVDKE